MLSDTDQYKSTVIFDIEANGLLETIDKVWVIAAKDADGSNEKVFTDQDCQGYVEPSGTLEDGVKHLLSYDRRVCHNIFGYDWFVLNRFWPNLWNMKTAPFRACWDTLVQSKVQHFDRQRLKGTKSQHGLEYFGLLFKYPKPSIEDWSYFDPEKLNRVLKDIEINRKTYLYLNKEARKIGLDFTTQFRRTSAAQFWYTDQEIHGWLGDKEHMEQCIEDLDKQIKELADEIEPNLPKQIKPKAPKCTWEDIRDSWSGFFRKVPKTRYDDDGKPIKLARKPTTKVFLKSGKYDRHTANHFDIPANPDESGRLVEAPYTKIEIHDTTMSQHDQVKKYLLSIGWQPTQWNYKKDSDGKVVRDDNGDFVVSSPKLTEDSFDSIKGDLGEKIAKYNTLVHRRRTIKNESDDDKGWLNQLRDDGRISGGAMAWATSTGRAAHRGVVNVPSGSAVYGAPMRKAWICPDDKVLVSVDMDSAQLRLLANYMGDDSFTEAVLEGSEEDEDGNYLGTDVHTVNTMAFGLITEDDVRKARETQDETLISYVTYWRKKGKNGIYALLFGAGNEKFANTLGFESKAKGGQIKKRYFQKLPKLKQLSDRLERQMNDNAFRGGGYIEVAGNTWVWCPSSHKALNYLLMGSEAVLENEALCWVNMKIRKEGLDGHQVNATHDDATFEFPERYEKRAKEIMSDMYGVASQRIGLDVLVTGTAKSGKDWLHVH